MSITVKRLIIQLEEFKSENNLSEVEICLVDNGFARREITRISKSSDGKILIFVEDKK